MATEYIPRKRFYIYFWDREKWRC